MANTAQTKPPRPVTIFERIRRARGLRQADVYGHLMPGSIDEVRERMDRYLATASAAQATASDQGAAI